MSFYFVEQYMENFQHSVLHFEFFLHIGYDMPEVTLALGQGGCCIACAQMEQGKMRASAMPGVEGRSLVTLVCTLWHFPTIHLADKLTLKFLVFKRS